MNNRIKVSIIIATYKGSRFIRKAIESVLAQTFADYELIILDDGPGDETGEVVREFEKERRIIYQRSEPPLGLFESANRGLREAKGEYIARIDDDDVWVDVDKLKKQVEFLDTHPEYVLVGTGVIGRDENGTELSRGFLPERDNEIREKMLAQNCFAHSSVMFRKSAAMASGGYREARRPYSEDYDLWLKLGTKGKLANLSIYGFGYTRHNRGVLFAFRERFIVAIKDLYLCGKYKDKYPHYWRAVSLRSVGILNVLLHIVSDVPPFIYLKRFLKSKCPTCWQAIKFSHRIILQGICEVIRLPSRIKKVASK